MSVKISVVIPTVKGREENLSTLVRQLGSSHEVIVVDNPEWSLAEKRNYGLAQATNDLIYFIDDDNQVFQETLVDLAMVMRFQPTVGIAASMAVWNDRVVDGGAFRYTFTSFMEPLNVNEKVKNVYPRPYDVDDCANAFMVRRKVFQEVGGFDAKHFPMDMDEADLCIRARKKGWRVVYVPSSRVKHPPVPTVPRFRRRINAYYMGRNKILFQKKHLSPFSFGMFTVTFLFVFVVVYTVSMVLNGQNRWVKTFLTGVKDGLFNKLDRAERHRD